MATSKTGSFWLTETVTLASTATAGDRVAGTLGLGSYVDVGDQQALAIEQVDFIWQAGPDYGSDIAGMVTGHGTLGCQVSDQNEGAAFVRADDHSLIASGAFSGNSATSTVGHSSDFYPDSFGKLDESRMVVNDSLYIVAGVDATDIDAVDVYCTVRIKARIVKLSTKDWMAIAIQSTAADN